MHTEADLLPPPPLALWWVCLVCVSTVLWILSHPW